MELKPEIVKRACHCGAVSFPVTVPNAERIDAGETGIRCGQACWGVYLARNSDKKTGKP